MEIGNRGKKTTHEGKNFVVAARNQSKQEGVLTVLLRPFGGGEELPCLLVRGESGTCEEKALLGGQIHSPFGAGDRPTGRPLDGVSPVVIVESAADARILRNAEATERVQNRGGTRVPLQ
jgi:hypothetical protein